MCLILTGRVACGEHKYWCGPWFGFRFGFAGRISTPSLLKYQVLPQRKTDFTTLG
jgi:hypothetical protein